MRGLGLRERDAGSGMLIVALALAVAGGLLYSIIAAFERGDARSARSMLIPLVLAFCLALVLMWRFVQYGP
jgi:hypothetical protein